MGYVDRTEALKFAGNDELIGVDDGEEHEMQMIALEKVVDG